MMNDEAWREENRKKQAAGTNEVKPKTVAYYFALYKTASGIIGAISDNSKKWIEDWAVLNGQTIIGNIETREVEV